MSFSSQAKAELCQQKLEHRSLCLAEAYGVLLYGNSFSPREIRIVTAGEDFARRLPKLFRRAFSLSFDQLPPEGCRGKFSFVIRDPEKLRQIYAAFGLETAGSLVQHINFGALEETGCPEAFVRGAFLAGGSVTDPDKRYHLELATPHHSVSRELMSLLLDMELHPKESSRAGNTLLYFKKADMIADFFTRIGAPVTAMNVMTAKVDREMRNTVTRQINCDSANTDKTVAAAQQQLDAIRRVVKAYGLDGLPEGLRDAALLRLTNPAASLADLALLSDPPVSKSCLNYRLKKIMSLVPKDEK